MIFANKLQIKHLQKKENNSLAALINIIQDDILHAHNYKV